LIEQLILLLTMFGMFGWVLYRAQSRDDFDASQFLRDELGHLSIGRLIACFCFGVHTWPAERGPLASRLDGDRATYGWINRECNNGLVHFHRNMLNAAAVICPRGHGLDTLRMWEALYLGRVIVTRCRVCWISSTVTMRRSPTRAKRTTSNTCALKCALTRVATCGWTTAWKILDNGMLQWRRFLLASCWQHTLALSNDSGLERWTL
jgi:hypothetical protein